MTITATKYNAPPFLGDYIQTTQHGYLGRVYKTHYGCPQDRAWINQQSIPVTEEQMDEKWVSVLVHGGGAIVTWASDCTVIGPIVNFVSSDGGMNFRPEA